MTDISAFLREPPATESLEPDIDVRQPCRIWILANGEPPPRPDMLVVPTRHPYIHLAMEKGDSDEEQRGRQGDFADTSTEESFAAYLRSGERSKIH